MAKKKWKPKTNLGKMWYFIWYDNSLWSWVVNIILAFVLIKFIIYPGLGAILGTNLPVVAVVSESMDHKFTNSYDYSCDVVGYRLCTTFVANKPDSPKGYDLFWDHCGEWYENAGLTKEEFSTFPFKNGFNKGDIIILIGKDPEDISLGEVIVFQAKNRPYPIIHRVVNKTLDETYVFQTKGDHNAVQIVDPMKLNERHIDQDQVLGVAVSRIPLLGWVKIGLVEFLQGKTCHT